MVAKPPAQPGTCSCNRSFQAGPSNRDSLSLIPHPATKPDGSTCLRSRPSIPTSLPGRALAVAGGDLFLIDTANLTATWIEFGEPATDLSPNPVQFRGTAGTRYVLLGSPSFDLTVLVDVQEGRATNLTALVVPPAPDAAVFIPFAAVTPDDAHVVMWDGQHVYIVDTANPEGARRIDTGAFAFAPDFSPDGQDVIFSQSDGPGSGSELVLEAIDGSASAVIDSSEHALVTLWVPRSQTVLVDERTEAGAAAGSVYLLDIDSGRETAVAPVRGFALHCSVRPGRHARVARHRTNGLRHLAPRRSRNRRNRGATPDRGQPCLCRALR